MNCLDKPEYVIMYDFQDIPQTPLFFSSTLCPSSPGSILPYTDCTHNPHFNCSFLMGKRFKQ